MKENETVVDYKKKYGKIYAVSATVVDSDNNCEEKKLEFIFKQPGAADYDRFIMDASKKATKAFRNLLVGSIIDEQKTELDEALINYPAVAASLSQQLLKLMGLSDDVDIKKL